MTVDELRSELNERIEDARRDADRSLKADANTYGAGYDVGFWQALKEIRACVE